MRVCVGIALLLAGVEATWAQQYVISTIAGGAPLPSPVASANVRLPPPGPLALDSAGNLYVASNNSLMEISPSGVMTRVAGIGRIGYSGDGGPAVKAQLQNIAAITVDAAGNVYISDNLSHRVRKISVTDGTINSIAGNGTPGFAGDGGPAINAELNGATALALDKTGNLYIADTGNNRVREMSANGIITTVAGTGLARYAGDNFQAIYASLNAPDGLAFDPSGYLYIADSKNYVVRKIGYGSVITTVAGVGRWQKGGLDLKPNTPATSVPIGTVGPLAFGPLGLLIADPDNTAVWQVQGGIITQAAKVLTIGLAVDSVGNIYCENDGIYAYAWEEGWSGVYQISPGGTRTTLNGGIDYWGGDAIGDGGPATEAQLYYPAGIALDGNGNLFIADKYNSEIRMVDANGIIDNYEPAAAWRTPQGTNGLFFPNTVAFDASGNLYVADQYELRVVNPKDVVSDFLPYNSTTHQPGVGFIESLAGDVFGNLYLTNTSEVLKVYPNKTLNVVAGIACAGDGPDNVGANTSALNDPMSVAADQYDNFYIADSGNHRVRKVSGGMITTVAGNGTQGFKGDGGPAISAELDAPAGVAIDSAGNLYIADTGNNRIRRVATDGTITTIAGNGTLGYTGDLGPATSAQLNAPGNLLIDKAGNIYFADTGNNAVRVLSGMEPLSFAHTVLPNDVTGVAYSAALAVSGGVLPYSWSVTSGVFPEGLALSNSGRISGTPNAAGTFNFTLAVTDATSATAAQALTIVVTAPLAISLPASSQAIVGTPYSQALAVSGGTPPYVWTVNSGSLPSGLVLTSDGVVYGTPTVAGFVSCSVVVTDAGGLIASGAIVISAVNPAPAITTAALPAGTIGTSYTAALAATVGNPPASWSIAGGTLPPGLQLSADGVISGTPATAGAYTFNLAITDSAGLVSSQAFQMTVIDPGSVGLP